MAGRIKKELSIDSFNVVEGRILTRKYEVISKLGFGWQGKLFSIFLKKLPGKRLNPFQVLNLLHALTKGIEEIQNLKEYPGDLHPENIIVRRYGLRFDLKLLDMFHWSTPKKQNIQDDSCDLIRLFYEALGKAKRYNRHPLKVKAI